MLTTRPFVFLIGALHASCILVGNAQIVTGTVRSAGAPVVGATVRLLELDRVQRTGALGQFAFNDVPAGRYRLFAGVIGYAIATDTITVRGGTTAVAVELRPSAVSLEEVIVSASPVASTTSDTYQSSASKARVEFLQSAGTSFAEKIADLPGVAVRGNGSAPSRPILRGLSDNEVLVLENGLRMGDLATYDPAHATPIDALSIAQIDVVRGPATILYGPSTIGGVVNLITDIIPVVSDHPLSGTAVVESNSVSDLVTGYLHNVYSDGGHAIGVSGALVRARDIRIPAGEYTDPGSRAVFDLDHMPQTFERSGAVGAGYSYQGSAGTIGVGGRHFEMDYGVPGVPPNVDFLTVPPTTSRIAQQRNTLELRGVFNTEKSFATQIRLSTSYNEYSHGEFPTAQDSNGVSDPQANHFRKREVNGVLQVRHQPARTLQGTLGLWTNVEQLNIEGDEPLGPNSVTIGLAGYAYEEYLVTEQTR